MMQMNKAVTWQDEDKKRVILNSNSDNKTDHDSNENHYNMTMLTHWSMRIDLSAYSLINLFFRINYITVRFKQA